MDASNAEAAGMFGGVSMVFIIGLLVLWVFLIIARWKMFTKAGEAGWKSIIPIYADYIQWKIGWQKTSLFWVYLLLGVAGCVLLSMSGALTEQIVYSGMVNTPLALGGCVSALASGILALVAVFKLFKSFGYGVGMFIAYIFFAPIVLLVLGFGSAQWEGAQP